MGSKSKVIGMSNYKTNNTCVFGSMAGLAPTMGVRPWITAIPGYKYTRAYANGVDWVTGASLNAVDLANGCGHGRNCDDGKLCMKFIGGTKSSMILDPVRGHLLG